MWQKLKPKKPNIAIKVILKPNVAQFEINIVTIEVDNQMVVIQMQVGKNTVEDVLLDGRAKVIS
jgi:hypothetical protein